MVCLARGARPLLTVLWAVCAQVEVGAKLFFTGVLQFIEPDSTAQVFAGLSIAFAYMVRAHFGCVHLCRQLKPGEGQGGGRLFILDSSLHSSRLSLISPALVLRLAQVLFLLKRPYADKGVRHVGFVGSLLLFLFLLFGLLIKGGVEISRDSGAFYAAVVGIAACATFSVPTAIVVRRWLHADIVRETAWKKEITSDRKKEATAPAAEMKRQQEEMGESRRSAASSPAASVSPAVGADAHGDRQAPRGGGDAPAPSAADEAAPAGDSVFVLTVDTPGDKAVEEDEWLHGAPDSARGPRGGRGSSYERDGAEDAGTMHASRLTKPKARDTSSSPGNEHSSKGGRS